MHFNYFIMYDTNIWFIIYQIRSAVKAVIDRLTFSAYTTAARGMLERDRFIYALLLAIEVRYFTVGFKYFHIYLIFFLSLMMF